MTETAILTPADVCRVLREQGIDEFLTADYCAWTALVQEASSAIVVEPNWARVCRVIGQYPDIPKRARKLPEARAELGGWSRRRREFLLPIVKEAVAAMRGKGWTVKPGLSRYEFQVQ